MANGKELVGPGAALIMALFAGQPVAMALENPEATKLSAELELLNEVHVLEGGEANLRSWIRNSGSARSSKHHWYVVRSEDASVTGDDQIIYRGNVPELDPQGGVGFNWHQPLIVTPGSQWLFLCTWPDATESVVADAAFYRSCSRGVEIRGSRMDLVVSHVETRPARIVSGVTVIFRAKVLNQGKGASAPGKLFYYLSRNPDITSGDSLLGTDAVPGLEPGESWSHPVSTPVTGRVGDYWVGACVREVVGEIPVDNNCSAGYQLAIVEDRFPDLVIDRVAVRPESWNEGVEVDFYAQVANAGAARSTATRLVFYLSEHSEPDPSDLPFAEVEVEAIQPGRRSEVDLFQDAGAVPGLYWLIACVLPVDDEIDSYNNCGTGPQVEILPFNFSD
ncbi:CARDB domain-containing protein [Elongatibacter sediminis]|uniref:CARDB domain-containing protein n=1 Tax=Elongatibacter sediminis TaxID=3119006 RepID=A0AAW9RH09_9GAMM